MILGVDGSGVVAETGAQVRRLKKGDRVYAYSYGSPKGGFYAEYVAVSASKVAPVPKPLDMLHAGGLPTIGLTALQGVDDALQISDLLFPRRVDGGADALLRTIQVRRLEDEKGENEVHYGVALTVSCARRRSSASRSACFRSRSSRT